MTILNSEWNQLLTTGSYTDYKTVPHSSKWSSFKTLAEQSV